MYEYKVGGNENNYESTYQGPFEILKVNENGTICLTVNSVMDTYNIRCLVPYMPENNTNHGGECNMQISKKRRKS